MIASRFTEPSKASRAAARVRGARERSPQGERSRSEPRGPHEAPQGTEGARGPLQPGHRPLVAIAVALGAIVTGCFSYDSRWFEHEAEKKRAAERLHPASLSAGPARAGERHSALVRAHATRAYAAETLNWERQFEALLQEANRVLEPALGLTLENGGASLWAPETGESEPTVALKELSKHDAGDGAEWVVGFLQSVPKLVTDYHRLGVGGYFSKYLVVRGSADPREGEALSRFEGLSSTEREEIYSERRRHKIATVFLHEIGHTLGAAHRTAHDTIMSPTYDSHERGFDETSLAIMRITLPHHLAGMPFRAAPAVLEYVQKDDGGWVGSERAELVERLKALGAYAAAHEPRQPPSVPVASAPATSSTPEGQALLPATSPLPFTSMTRADRATFEVAAASERAGDTKTAWATAHPLFDANPRVVEVQDLRCRLAKTRGFIATVVTVHCARLEALVAGGATGTPQ
jgi:hypothetical protein